MVLEFKEDCSEPRGRVRAKSDKSVFMDRDILDFREAVVYKCDINGCGLAEVVGTLPSNRYQDRPVPAARSDSVQALADFLCLLQTLDRDRDVVTHHVGDRVQPERHGDQGHGQGRWGDHPHVLLMSLLSLGASNGHWGHWCVFTGSLRIQHWLRNTEELRNCGHRVAARASGQAGSASSHSASRWHSTACQERLLTTLRIIAILTFLILQLQLNVTRKWKIHQHNFKLKLPRLLCSPWPWGCWLEVRSDPRSRTSPKFWSDYFCFLFTKNWLPRVSTVAPHLSVLTPPTLSANTEIEIHSLSPFLGNRTSA